MCVEMLAAKQILFWNKHNICYLLEFICKTTAFGFIQNIPVWPWWVIFYLEYITEADIKVMWLSCFRSLIKNKKTERIYNIACSISNYAMVSNFKAVKTKTIIVLYSKQCIVLPAECLTIRDQAFCFSLNCFQKLLVMKIMLLIVWKMLQNYHNGL